VSWMPGWCCSAFITSCCQTCRGLDDATELACCPGLTCSRWLHRGGFAARSMMPTGDDVEILGWLYQFYIAEKKKRG